MRFSKVELRAEKNEALRAKTINEWHSVAYVKHVRIPEVELHAEKNETLRALLAPDECTFQSKSAEAPS